MCRANQPGFQRFIWFYHIFSILTRTPIENSADSFNGKKTPHSEVKIKHSIFKSFHYRDQGLTRWTQILCGYLSQNKIQFQVELFWLTLSFFKNLNFSSFTPSNLTNMAVSSDIECETNGERVNGIIPQDLTDFELKTIRKLQKWSIIFWSWFWIEHIPITYAFSDKPKSEYLKYLCGNYNLWFFIFGYNLIYSWYLADPYHRPIKFRSLCPLYLVIFIQIFNIIFCFYWTVIEVWFIGDGPYFYRMNECRYPKNEMAAFGTILVYFSFPMLFYLIKIEISLYKYWTK